ncbi:expressed unknown protein [Seminavis robusta]|uniref:Uncharacterized protein n=1 Tax=Seminavis robusta TaxID=568900 RepID=A0A9N8DFY4_9STRA|nr:expressed unknown protein [Seminavis robusta]|eukprot:Sro132_g062491.1  (112) ;mRNA; r:32437-32772
MVEFKARSSTGFVREPSEVYECKENGPEGCTGPEEESGGRKMENELNEEKSFYLSTGTVFLASTKPYHIAYLPTMMVLSSNNKRNLCILQTNKRREVIVMVVLCGGDWSWC